jgi:uncharacterized membrane protein YeaQ/YmgE (transglycosylase-associated protein family)
MENLGTVLVMVLMVAMSGLVVGALARWLLPGPDPMSWAKTIFVGIAGSFLGALIGRLFGYNPAEPSLVGLVLSVGGAILILLLYRRFSTHAVR